MAPEQTRAGESEAFISWAGMASKSVPDFTILARRGQASRADESMNGAREEFRRVFEGHDLGLSDALEVLRHQFSPAMQTPGGNTVVYRRNGQDALTLAFTRKGKYAGVHVGPGLDDDDLTQLTAAFRAARPRHVMSVVFFSTVPTTGWWRYRDRFQILAMPPEAPRPPRVFAGVHPALLEVAYDGSEINTLDEFRGAVATREVNRLLSALLRGTEDRLGQFARQDWVVLQETDASGAQHRQSHFGQLGYSWRGERATRELDFTPIPDSAIQLKTVPKDEYYAQQGISELDVLTLPDNLQASLDSYFGLPIDEQDKTLRWCHWLNHARQVAALSPSASIIAAVQSVEALLPSDPSIGKRFKQFLEQYAPGESHTKYRDLLYRSRSRLAHGGALLTGELRHLAFRDFIPKSWGEREDGEQALVISRLAGTNWLLAHTRQDDTATGP